MVGAGLAGLTAARALLQAQFKVTLLEARDVPGGRCRTMDFGNFVADLGPEFVSTNHDYTLRVATECGMHVTSANQTDNEESRVALSEDEEAVLDKVRETAKRIVPHWLRGKGLAGEPNIQQLHDQLDTVSMAEFLKHDFGASESTVQTIGRDLASLMGTTMQDVSALRMLQELALHSEVDGAEIVDVRLAGGTCMMTDRLAQQVVRLGGVIHYNEVVSGLEQLTGSSLVDVKTSRTTYTSDAVIVSMPLPCMQAVTFTPALPPTLQQAIREIKYGDIVKVALQFDHRWWVTEDGEMHPQGKAIGTSGVVYDCANYSSGDVCEQSSSPEGVLMAYLTPPMSDEIRACESNDAQIERTLDYVRKLVPDGTDMRFQRGVVQDWKLEPYACGAYAVFGKSQQQMRMELRKAHGRIFFAGEHTSEWQGYMNGAIESGHRVAWDLWEVLTETSHG